MVLAPPPTVPVVNCGLDEITVPGFLRLWVTLQAAPLYALVVIVDLREVMVPAPHHVPVEAPGLRVILAPALHCVLVKILGPWRISVALPRHVPGVSVGQWALMRWEPLYVHVVILGLAGMTVLTTLYMHVLILGLRETLKLVFLWVPVEVPGLEGVMVPMFLGLREALGLRVILVLVPPFVCVTPAHPATDTMDPPSMIHIGLPLVLALLMRVGLLLCLFLTTTRASEFSRAWAGCGDPVARGGRRTV